MNRKRHDKYSKTLTAGRIWGVDMGVQCKILLTDVVFLKIFHNKML